MTLKACYERFGKHSFYLCRIQSSCPLTSLCKWMCQRVKIARDRGWVPCSRWKVIPRRMMQHFYPLKVRLSAAFRPATEVCIPCLQLLVPKALVTVAGWVDFIQSIHELFHIGCFVFTNVHDPGRLRVVNPDASKPLVLSQLLYASSRIQCPR